MPKAAIYCRLSDEDKDKKNDFDDSESIQNQKNMLTKYAIEREWEIYKIYSDDDFSGLDADRPEWCQMLADAELHKFDIVLCKSQSRFTRDMELVEKYLHNKFLEWGIRFVGITDNADTENKGNKKQRQIMGLTNEWYCEDISENVKAVFNHKKKSGEFIGSFACYGYKKNPNNKNKLIIDEEPAKVVEMIYDWYLQGFGTQHISYMLNERNIQNPTTYKQSQGLNFKNASQSDGFGLWNKTTVKRILKNEMYVGNMVQGIRKKVSYKSKKVIPIRKEEWIIIQDTHEPIISKETFKEVQIRMKYRKRSSGEGKAHLFSTKLRCGDCGNIMHKNSTFRRGVRYSYFRCKIYAVDPNKSLCTRHGIRYDHLEEVVIEKLRKYFNQYLDDNLLFQQNVNDEINEEIESLSKELSLIEKQFQQKSLVLRNLYEDKITGLITTEQFIEMNKGFSSEKDSLEKRKVVTSESIEELKAKTSNHDKLVDYAFKYKNLSELTREIVNEFIDYIEVFERDNKTNEQKIKIHWRF